MRHSHQLFWVFLVVRILALVSLAMMTGMLVRYNQRVQPTPKIIFAGYMTLIAAIAGVIFHVITSDEHTDGWWFSPVVLIGSSLVCTGLYSRLDWPWQKERDDWHG